MSKNSKSQRRRFNWVLFLIICILVVFAFILSESDKIEHASQTSRTIQMGLLQTAEPTIILPSPPQLGQTDVVCICPKNVFDTLVT